MKKMTSDTNRNVRYKAIEVVSQSETPSLLHLVVLADLALHAQDVSGLLQLLDGFSVSGSELSDGALCAAAASLLHLLQEAQATALLGFTCLRERHSVSQQENTFMMKI